jgi:CBS domain-containing protein
MRVRPRAQHRYCTSTHFEIHCLSIDVTAARRRVFVPADQTLFTRKALQWAQFQHPLQEGSMKSSDTIALLLKSKAETKVHTITPDQSVYEAIQLMAKYDIGALLVISDNRVVGILSERDYARKGVLMGHPSKETQVHQIMTTPVFFVSPQHTVDECMSIMTEHHFRHLPVLQGETLVGVVSIGDMVKWVISGHEKTIQELQGYITGAYPG